MNPENEDAYGSVDKKHERTREFDDEKYGQAQGPAPTGGGLALGDVVGQFKSLTMHKYILGVRNHRWKPFYKNLWQRNYYEHVIRNEKDLRQIREYIVNNPLKWELDEENPNKL